MSRSRGSGSLSGEDVAFHLSNGIKYIAAFQDAFDVGNLPQREAAFYWMENNAETKFTDYNTVKNLFEKELETKAWELHEINDSLTLDDVNFDEVVTILQKKYNFNYGKEML